MRPHSILIWRHRRLFQYARRAFHGFCSGGTLKAAPNGLCLRVHYSLLTPDASRVSALANSEQAATRDVDRSVRLFVLDYSTERSNNESHDYI
jgi:hypothetical protein